MRLFQKIFSLLLAFLAINASIVEAASSNSACVYDGLYDPNPYDFKKIDTLAGYGNINTKGWCETDCLTPSQTTPPEDSDSPEESINYSSVQFIMMMIAMDTLSNFKSSDPAPFDCSLSPPFDQEITWGNDQVFCTNLERKPNNELVQTSEKVNDPESTNVSKHVLHTSESSNDGVEGEIFTFFIALAAVGSYLSNFVSKKKIWEELERAS